MPVSRGRASKGRNADGSSRDTLLNAAALQDHLTRRLRIPGGPKVQPSTQPGADMTLAQHRGLVPRPPALLTEEQWGEVALQSRLRQDSLHECPICREDFKDDPQVLLSCSHVFHRSCLASFERFARQQVCPLCRAEQYQKRIIQDGKDAYRHNSATRIQAAFRGWLARRTARQLRRQRPPPSDPRLRARWAAEQLQDDSNRIIAQMNEEREDIDALFAELDANVMASRRVCDAIVAPLARQLRQTGHSGTTDRPGTSYSQTPSTSRNSLDPAAHSAAPATSRSCAAHGHVEVDWDSVRDRAAARGDTECTICLGPLQRRGNAGVCWLSCTHTFHLDCITAFEAFELTRGGQPSCPVCRAKYQRRGIN